MWEWNANNDRLTNESQSLRNNSQVLKNKAQYLKINHG